MEAAEAVALLERALAIAQKELGQSRLETASIQLNLASSLLKVGRPNEAHRAAAEAAAVFKDLLGPGHRRTAAAELIQSRSLEAVNGPRQ